VRHPERPSLFTKLVTEIVLLDVSVLSASQAIGLKERRQRLAQDCQPGGTPTLGGHAKHCFKTMWQMLRVQLKIAVTAAARDRSHTPNALELRQAPGTTQYSKTTKE